jgi:hypothetical protein
LSRRPATVLLTLLLLLAVLQGYPDSSRSVGIFQESPEAELRMGRQHLVVIAVNRYQHWMPLLSPVRDTRKLKEILVSRYHVDEVHELYDEAATKANIIKLFVDLQKTVKADDSLLVLYSGHGHLDENSDTGFWIPVNAGTDVYEQRNWLPHSQLRGLIGNISATHILVISDSCFAGDLIYSTRSLPLNITSDYFKGAYSRVSRQVLTSGAVEAVPDESTFSDQLISVLERNDRLVLDALMLFNEVRLGVVGSTPVFGSLPGTGHQEGASFLLFLKEDALHPDGQGSDMRKPEGLPASTAGSGTTEVTGSTRPRRFSAGLTWGWNILIGVFEPAFKSGPSTSCRFHYHFPRERGEIGVGLRVGALILTGKEDLDNPYYPDTVDGTAWLLAASLGYVAHIDPPLYLAAELSAGAAVNLFKYYTPALNRYTDTKPYLGSAVGVGLRLLDRLNVTVYGRFTAIPLDEGVFLGIAPEIAAEYSF